MMITTHHFQKRGHRVVFYHDSPTLLSPLFPGISFVQYPSVSAFEEVFDAYDWVVVENDNSERAWALIRLRQSQKLSHITFLFPTPCKKAAEPYDYLFNH